ncbi:MAG: SpoIID/LytB domain-containing protein [Candidatus Obscuribacterales bacterium]|nr:SpoIID/LytB domain-containing protein [Candidatus Obscuribacterales bacterium]
MATTILTAHKITVTDESQPTESEIAAAFACVLSVLSENASDATATSTATDGSGWKQASLLESVGGIPGVQAHGRHKLSLWQRANFIKFCFIAFFMVTANATSVQAEESQWLEDDLDAPVKSTNQIASSSSSALVNYSKRSNPQTPVSPIKFGVLGASPQFASCVRIGLSIGVSHVDITALDGSKVIDAQTGTYVANLGPASQWSIDSSSNSQISFSPKRGPDSSTTAFSGTTIGTSRYKNVAFFPGAAASRSVAIRLPIKPALEGINNSTGYIIKPASANGVTAIDGKVYRGSLYLLPTASGFNVINVVNLEDYVLSVLPSEMPSNWALEALKAQAIAARSYAVANLNKHAKDGYDLTATIADQVYSGVVSESDNSNRAVAETEGMVLKYQGKPITAFFHSTSGGATELAENVWSKPLPYLQAVADYDDSSPHFSWNRKFTVSDIERAIPSVGQLLSFDVVARTPSKRAQYVLAQGTRGCQMISGESMRKIFKLPSSLFNVGNEDNSYVFAGRGFGHGLGMSQYGARALADRGYNAAQILSYYYKDVVVDFIGTAPGI